MATSLTRMSAKWRFILHGGATDTCPNVERQTQLIQGLNTIADLVCGALSEGKSAKTAAILAVQALEDCEVFNAGRGASMTRSGLHQVCKVQHTDLQVQKRFLTSLTRLPARSCPGRWFNYKICRCGGS